MAFQVELLQGIYQFLSYNNSDLSVYNGAPKTYIHAIPYPFGPQTDLYAAT